MKFIVTGATGFLGQRLCNSLAAQGHMVIAFLQPNESAFPFPHEGIEFLNCDLTKPDFVPAFTNVDAVFHFAWAGVDSAFKNNQAVQEKNLFLAECLCRYMARIECPKVVVPGSASEYGGTNRVIDGIGLPSPVDSYSETKVRVRLYFENFCLKKHIILCWALITSIYGPGRGGSNILYCAIEAFKLNEVFHCTKLEQEWDFIFVDDVITGLTFLGIKNVEGGLYPLGSGFHRQLSWYIHKIKVEMHSTSLLCCDVPYKNGRIDNQVLDITRIYAETGFSPAISFDQGLKLWLDFLFPVLF